MANKEIYCSKCGKLYTSDLNKCPECGEANPHLFKKRLIGACKITATILACAMLITVFVLTIINTIKLDNLQKQVSSINITAPTQSDNGLGQQTNIEDYTFYDDYVLLNDVLPNKNEFFIYFHQTECEYCLSANTYIMSYYNVPTSSGSKEYIYDEIPVYFVNNNTQEGIALFEKYEIESTPTTLHFKNGVEVERGVGVETVDQYLGEVVGRYYPIENKK